MPHSRSNSHGSGGSHGSKGSHGGGGGKKEKKQHEPSPAGGNPKYNTKYWDEMPEIAHFAAGILRYTKEKWDKDEEVPYDTKSFFQCSVRERQAAMFLNLGLHKKKLNLWWDDVHEPTQDQAKAIGWSKEKWDKDYEVEDLPIDKLYWDELEFLQQRGAKHFGYTKATWNETWAAEDFVPNKDDKDDDDDDEADKPACGGGKPNKPPPTQPGTSRPDLNPHPDGTAPLFQVLEGNNNTSKPNQGTDAAPSKPVMHIPPLPKKDDDEEDNKEGEKPPAAAVHTNTPVHIAPLPKKEEEDKPPVHIAPMPAKPHAEGAAEEEKPHGGGFIKPFKKIFGGNKNDDEPETPAPVVASTQATPTPDPATNTQFIAPLPAKDDTKEEEKPHGGGGGFIKPFKKIFGGNKKDDDPETPAPVVASTEATAPNATTQQFIAPLPPKDDNDDGGDKPGYVRPHQKIFGGKQPQPSDEQPDGAGHEAGKPSITVAPLPKKEDKPDYVKPFQKIFGKPESTSDTPDEPPFKEGSKPQQVIAPLSKEDEDDDHKFIKPFKKLFGKEGDDNEVSNAVDNAAEKVDAVAQVVAPLVQTGDDHKEGESKLGGRLAKPFKKLFGRN